MLPRVHPSSLLYQKQWVILVTAALSLAVSIATLIALLATEWVCDPALGGFSPPDPAVLQCSIHLVAPTIRIGLFFLKVQKRADSFPWCPVSVLPLCPFFSQGTSVALTILRHLKMV